jgi:hypothetical protein
VGVKHKPGSAGVRAFFLVSALAMLVFVAAGCGGSKSPAVASLGTTASAGATTTTSGAGAAKASSNAFASCMTSHGFAPYLGSAATAGSQTLSVFGVQFSGVDPSSPQFQSAMQVCHKFLPGGGPPTLTPAQRAEHAKGMTNFAGCMRKNGVPSFPDPNGQGMFSPSSLGQLDPSSPLFQTAYKACLSLMPKVGPRLQFG